MSRLARTRAILLQRCPCCFEGRVFKSTLLMNEACPRCGVSFQREAGYFLGAMYFSYPLALAVLAPLLVFFRLIAPAWSFDEVVIVSCVAFLPFVPVTFRYSRILWLHFDDYWDQLGPGHDGGKALPIVGSRD